MSDWIPVTERMPKACVPVLAVAKDFEGWNGVVTAFHDLDGWFAQPSGEEVQITHWMPYPELPRSRYAASDSDNVRER